MFSGAISLTDSPEKVSQAVLVTLPVQHSIYVEALPLAWFRVHAIVLTDARSLVYWGTPLVQLLLACPAPSVCLSVRLLPVAGRRINQRGLHGCMWFLVCLTERSLHPVRGRSLFAVRGRCWWLAEVGCSRMFSCSAMLSAVGYQPTLATEMSTEVATSRRASPRRGALRLAALIPAMFVNRKGCTRAEFVRLVGTAI